MQEIKYRYFDKKENKFYYFSIKDLFDGFGTEYNMPDNVPWIDCDAISEIEQFTGKQDKNGKDIYAGDIVKCNPDKHEICYTDGTKRNQLPETYAENGDIFLVEYDNDVCGYAPFCNYDSDCGLSNHPSYFEIIGNVHQNPELLEDKP
ncbi:MAG: YopX family protein [Candidatus Omnitrophica bacterium]|nr:YopX family protein [Candidatus Omnitrophota bacterium]MDD5353099.1 YopX family protein [Candidatus Omnitrophota bacterium]